MGYTPNFMKSDAAALGYARRPATQRTSPFGFALLAVIGTVFVALLADTLLRG